MRFEEFRLKLPPVAADAARQEMAARRTGAERDPFATTAKRVMASRLVAQAEQKLGALDLDPKEWEGVAAKLGGYTEADWRALSSVDDLLP